MVEFPSELRKLADIAADKELPANLRTRAIEQLGNIGTHEALLALLELAANQTIASEEREHALREARDIVKSGH